jgi:hypothetical protein
MKTWRVSFVMTDDGLEDPSGEIKGKYFTKREIEREVKNANLTAGVRIHRLVVEAVPR